MARAIVLPLYPHTSDVEIEEIMETLRGVGLDSAVVVSGYITPTEIPRRDLGLGHALTEGHDPETCVSCFLRETDAIPGRAGWRRDRQGREWYSAAWLEGRQA